MASDTTTSTDGAPDTPAPRNLVTLRAILIGAILIPLNSYWILMVEGIWHTGHPTAISLAWNVIFNLLVLLAINLALKRFVPRHALTQAEFVTIYVMLAIASALAGHDTLQLGIPNLSHGWYFATEGQQLRDEACFATREGCSFY